MSAFYNVDQPPFNMGSVARAIAAANNGLLFDIGDMSTMFQDAAGTIPVAAVEQPVGLILDKSGNGNHATQSITASRPTLSARKNILLATETLATQSVTTLAAQHTLSFTGTGSVTLSGTATGTLTGPGVNDRVSLTVTPTAGTLTLTVSGSVTKAQLELGAVAGPYQRVTTSTDYDTDERYFPKYLKFDGVDDYLNLPYMGLYANGSASVVMGIKSSIVATARQFLTEGNSSNTTSLYTLIRSGSGTTFNTRYVNDAGGMTMTVDVPSVFGDGIAKVVAMVDTGGVVAPFVNASAKTQTTYSRTATTLNNTTIGAYINSSGAISQTQMNIYSLIIAKSALSDAQRIKCERYAARKAGVIL